MAMKVIDPERMLSVSRESTGYAPPDAKALTEMVRSELWARGVTTRRVLCDRITSLVQPLSNVKKEDVLSVLDEMERTGDVTVGPRGGVAAAPLRIVDAGSGRFRLFGSLPSGLISNVVSVGTGREISENSEETVSALIEQYGGVQLTVERWAGFDRVLPACPKWLEQLDARLESEAREPGGFDNELNGIWMVYRPLVTNGGGSKSPWRKPVANEEGNLWRGWSIYGWPINVWTAGRNPTVARYMRLTSDEASRTTFALCLQAGVRTTFKADAMGIDMVISFDTYLPIAEYRYLMTIGAIQDLGGTKRAFRIPLEMWPQVEVKLKERLGVTIESTRT